MKWKRAFAQNLSDGVSLLRGGRVARGYRVLMYHAVGTELSYDNYGISIAPDLFRRHMELLTAEPSCAVVPFGPSAHSEQPLCVAITFDDGYRDNLVVAAPILANLGLPFTVFVTSGYVRDGAPGCLAEAELRELTAMPGATIGAHGVTHRRLTQCDDDALQTELRDSRARLEDVISRPVTALSYPHGAVDARVRAAVEAAGYTAAACSRHGINAPGGDPLMLRRTEIVAADSERAFLQKLHGAWDWRGAFA